MGKAKESGITQKLNLLPKTRLLLIFPIIVFLNGFLPRLGVKNIQVMAMFSNLRTEGGKTNHLFIPSSFQLSDNFKDLVTVKGSNLRRLNQFSGFSSNSPLRETSVTLPLPYIEYMDENEKDYNKRFEYRIPFVLLQNM